jgi:hypothetical protein
MCGVKHISKAIILLSEAQLGYPVHFYLALGNLSEAEDELVLEYPELANKIRDLRLEIMEDVSEGVKLVDLLYELMELVE